MTSAIVIDDYNDFLNSFSPLLEAAKIIIVTADVTLGTNKKLTTLGVSDIVHKPINMKKF